MRPCAEIVLAIPKQVLDAEDLSPPFPPLEDSLVAKRVAGAFGDLSAQRSRPQCTVRIRAAAITRAVDSGPFQRSLVELRLRPSLLTLHLDDGFDANPLECLLSSDLECDITLRCTSTDTIVSMVRNFKDFCEYVLACDGRIPK
jgi:hypothetical protein